MNFKKAIKTVWLLLLICLILTPCSQAQTKLRRFEFSQRHMGTLFRIVLYHSDSVKANLAATAAFNRVSELNQILSDYEKDSELNKLSRTAGTNSWIKVSPEMWYILKKSKAISEKTKGAFDITVGPFVQLWRRARRQNELPTSEILGQVKESVGYQHILLNHRARSVKLVKPGMQLDMGAIGKGYAVDEALKVLKQFKIKKALVDGGGNIAVNKAPPKSNGWEIRLEPYTPADKPAIIYLKKSAIATSGDLYQFIEFNGVRYSHILNPFTGIGLTDQSRVIIFAKDGITADWLSTSVSVLGPEKGLELVRKTRGTKAIYIRNQNGQILKYQSH